jgi:hypothetical protein
MKQVLTAKTVLKNFEEDTIIFRDANRVPIIYFTEKQTKDLMIEFAKMHVEAALKEASEKATMYDDNEDCHFEDEEGNYPEYLLIDKNSILNSYPLSNIK